jgi:hypothetical protein
MGELVPGPLWIAKSVPWYKMTYAHHSLCFSFFFIDRVLLCSPGWPWFWTHDPPISASWVLWFQVCATMSPPSIYFIYFSFLIYCVLYFLVFWGRVHYISPGWLWTHNPSTSAFLCQDYMHKPPHPALLCTLFYLLLFIYLLVLGVEFS